MARDTTCSTGKVRFSSAGEAHAAAKVVAKRVRTKRIFVQDRCNECHGFHHTQNGGKTRKSRKGF